MSISTKSRRMLLILGLIAAMAVGYFAGTGGLHIGHEHVATGEPGQTEAKVQYTCSMHPFIIRDEPGLCPICGMQLTPIRPGEATAPPAERRVKYWVSPMDPTYVRDTPGKDNMDHDLVAVYEGGAAPGQVRIDPVTVQNMGLRTAPVERRDLNRTIRTVGLVDYEEPRQYVVNSKIDGWVERLYVNETGQFVKKGQPLLDIYSPELVAAQQEYLLALRNRDRLVHSPFPDIAAGGERLLEASRTRLKYWDISASQVAELEKSGQVHKSLTLYSPYSGVVTKKDVVAGMRVMSGADLLQISDLSRVWVHADIFEFEMPWVRTGLSATVELPFAAGPGRVGKITYLYPYVIGESRTTQARIEFENPGLELRPGMYTNVLIEAQTVTDVLAVPVNAVLRSGKRQTVFVALGEGRFEPKTVTTGVSDDEGFIQVLSGLRLGEQVVISAQFMLDSESRLQEAIEKMLAPTPTAGKAEIDLETLF